jgi:hypothetical protein
MPPIRSLVLAVPVLLALTAAAMAQKVTYICSLTVSAANGWVPEQVVILHDTGTGAVLVNDPMIFAYAGKPVEGEVVDESAKKIAFAWTVGFVTNRSAQTAKFRYRAAIIKEKMTVTITASPLGYRNNFVARGTCTAK